MKGFVVKLSYMVEWTARISMGAPQHYTGMQHQSSKRMMPEAATAFSYYDVVTCFGNRKC